MSQEEEDYLQMATWRLDEVCINDHLIIYRLVPVIHQLMLGESGQEQLVWYVVFDLIVYN